MLHNAISPLKFIKIINKLFQINICPFYYLSLFISVYYLVL